MFGTLKPSTCRLSSEQRGAWRQSYCGTCKALGDGYGLMSRATLSFDAALYALAAEALANDVGPSGASCRCPLMPVMFRPIVDPARPSVRASAAVQMLLADQWFRDQALDGRRALGSLRWLTGPKAAAAREELEGLGVSAEQFGDLAARQAALEVNGQTSPAGAAEPTAALLEHLFASLPTVARVDVDADALGRLGRAVGTAVYLLDAIEDLPRDAEEDGTFNPCLDADGSPTAPKLSAVSKALWHALDVIRDTVAVVPWRRHQTVLESALVTALRSRARRSIKATTEWLEAFEGPRTLWQRLWALALAPVVWLVRPVMLAADGPTPRDPDGSGGKRKPRRGMFAAKDKGRSKRKKSSSCDDCCCCCDAWDCGGCACDSCDTDVSCCDSGSCCDCSCDCGDCCDCSSCCDC